MENYDVKFLCSYGSEIHHRPNDKKISYVGGRNKLHYVNRGIDFTAMLAELSALFDAASDIHFKYQLPGDDFDALISVTSDNGRNSLMLEYDNLYRDFPKTAQMRLFIFPGNGPDSASTQPFPAKLKSKVNGGAVVPPQITPMKDEIEFIQNIVKDGTDSIESIVFDMSQIADLQLNADTFKKMPKLRFLKLYIPSKSDGRLNKLQLPVGLKPFPSKLRYLEWDAYPLPSLPLNFCPEKLVTLRIRNSKLKRLWDGVQNLVNLEEVDLTDSQKLVELPDFSKTDNLKSVHLSGCRSLRHVHPSLLSLGKLELLNLLNCAKLEMLETKMHSKSLKHLYIKSRTSLSYVSHFSSLRKLLLDGSPVETLPVSIKHLTELKTLSLKGCKML
ncbi:hypothetical protein Ahy_A09g044600 isoform B [Arachis hypogaea]|uniref:PB1 domain-containing protein n=1 Tax=Arachis hypogaea TaxID=3818 RepID=A0A445BKE6_ARAHY|nr:hypothetical protein Ahy_A09g044600 isoform B [Arachis hypogaea]